MTQRTRGSLVVKAIKKLTLDAVYPIPGIEHNLNTCGDPDCGNYGVAVDPIYSTFRGRNAVKRRLAATVAMPHIANGYGSYKLNGDDKALRISTAFEYEDDPHEWNDGRNMTCLHNRKNGVCDVSFSVLSNDHLVDEISRLLLQSGKLEGPKCRNCGVRYLDKPDEFVFNGSDGKRPSKGKNKTKAASIRLLHRPCRGKTGAKLSVALEHQKQQELRGNVAILRELVNGASFNDIRRILKDPDTGKMIGVSRLYSRIFWLERVLLAFEQAKLREWRVATEASDHFSHMRIAHDDITISCNWETTDDRRLTAIYCSVSADIRSGYVFRIDANFDPRIDPVEFIEQHYLDGNKQKDLNLTYSPRLGPAFTAPKLHFQRPSGRFDEGGLFAAAESHWRVFSSRITTAYDEDPSGSGAIPPDALALLQHSLERRELLDMIRNRYFAFGENNRDFRGSFNGIMVHQTYTKAAHFECIKKMLPKGKITLIGEQESQSARVVPHIFRSMIQNDMFEWFVISFDKEASKPKTHARISAFQEAFDKYKSACGNFASDDYALLREFCAIKIKPFYREDEQGNRSPFPISNFQSRQFPSVWLKSPEQIYGETEKVVGFPVLRKKYRERLKRCDFDYLPPDPELRAALARRSLSSTLQPVSVFMNSVRARISSTMRAGGRSARNGPSYINGALFNPAVLVALLNIYRVHYNWFEPRQYTAGRNSKANTIAVEAGVSSIRLPGSSTVVQVPKRRAVAPLLSTPASRLGADTRATSGSRANALDPRRIFYRPWLYHGTLWKKLEER